MINLIIETVNVIGKILVITFNVNNILTMLINKMVGIYYRYEYILRNKYYYQIEYFLISKYVRRKGRVL